MWLNLENKIININSIVSIDKKSKFAINIRLVGQNEAESIVFISEEERDTKYVEILNAICNNENIHSI